MKKTKFLISSLLSLMLVGCAGNGDEPVDKDQKAETVAMKYAELSTKPMVSALDIALGKVSPTKAEDCIIGLTDEDAEYIMSLDEVGLQSLQTQVMEVTGIDSIDGLEEAIDNSYNSVCESLGNEEVVEFLSFVDCYFDMPQGITSALTFSEANILQVILKTFICQLP